MEPFPYFKTVEIVIAVIWRDPHVDARIFQKPDAVRRLANSIASMREPGVVYVQELTPTLAAEAPRGSRYRLVSGWDLLEAARLLGRQAVEARVLPSSVGEREVRLLNLREALRLRVLSTYERAHALEMLAVSCSMSIEDIGASLAEDGCHRSTIKDALAQYRALCPPLLDAWRDGDPLLTARLRRELAKLDGPEQLREWQARKDRELAAKLGHSVVPEEHPKPSDSEPPRAVRRSPPLMRRSDGLVRALVEGLRAGLPTSWSAAEVAAVLSVLAWAFEGADLDHVQFPLVSKRGRKSSRPPSARAGSTRRLHRRRARALPRTDLR
ncbi:MAG: hypothetical protein SFX73_00910 [Kofleriaceae bacterium]|nr:hypothetical protein [Kofleriaceae bacterium]